MIMKLYQKVKENIGKIKLKTSNSDYIILIAFADMHDYEPFVIMKL